MEKIVVEVQPDHLEKLARVRRPLDAVSELIWNALDADATQVDISIHTSELGAIDRITVVDDGCGLAPDFAKTAFKKLGGSSKRSTDRTPTRRASCTGKLARVDAERSR